MIMRRYFRSAAIVSMLTAAAMTGIVLGGAKSAAASVYPDALCAAFPSSANCDGVAILDISGDPCFANIYEVRPAGDPIYVADGYDFITELMYSQPCQTNFALTTVVDVSANQTMTYGNKVRRSGAGPDGPYLMEHSGATTAWPTNSIVQDVISPMVWCPHNPAQACLATLANDQANCTAYA